MKEGKEGEARILFDNRTIRIHFSTSLFCSTSFFVVSSFEEKPD